MAFLYESIPLTESNFFISTIENPPCIEMTSLKENLLKQLNQHTNQTKQALLQEKTRVYNTREAFLDQIKAKKLKTLTNQAYLHRLLYLKGRQKFECLPGSSLGEHINKKCLMCESMPILGNRYKCSVCSDYSLCEKCELKMRYIHKHNFCLISQPQRQESFITFTDNTCEDINAKLLNANELKAVIPYRKSTSDLKINIKMKNTGKKSWPSKLSLDTMDKDSDVLLGQLSVRSIEPNTEITIEYKISQTKLNSLEIGFYTIVFCLRYRKNYFGDKIPLRLIIEEVLIEPKSQKKPENSFDIEDDIEDLNAY